MSQIKFYGTVVSDAPDKYGIVFADQISGHKTVPTLIDLLNIPDSILSKSVINENNDAIGQLWYVIEQSCHYRLVNWNNRRYYDGWAPVVTVTPNELKSVVDLSKNGIIWKEAVATVSDISTRYNNPQQGWAVFVEDTKEVQFYNNGQWIRIFDNILDTNPATTSNTGFMTPAQVQHIEKTWNTLINTRLALQSAKEGTLLFSIGDEYSSEIQLPTANRSTLGLIKYPEVTTETFTNTFTTNGFFSLTSGIPNTVSYQEANVAALPLTDASYIFPTVTGSHLVASALVLDKITAGSTFDTKLNDNYPGVVSKGFVRKLQTMLSSVSTDINTKVTQLATDINNKLSTLDGKISKLKTSNIITIKRNGIAIPPTTDGVVDIQVPTTIDEQAITQIVNNIIEERELGSGKFNVETEDLGEDGTKLIFTTLDQQLIDEVVVKGGGGGTGTGVSQNKITLTLTSDKNIVQLGSKVYLRYSYNNTNDGQPTGISATLTLKVKKTLGTETQIFSKTVAATGNENTVDVSDYLKELASYTFTLVAETEDNMRKIVAFSINVNELHIELQSTEVFQKIATGGVTSDFNFAYYIWGGGIKTTKIIVNGRLDAPILDSNISSTTKVPRTVSIPSTLLVQGRNTIQLRAESGGLYSETIFFDVLYNPTGTANQMIGLYIPDTKNDLISDTHLTPIIKCEQYNSIQIYFIAYNTPVFNIVDKTVTNTYVGTSSIQTFNRRYKDVGDRTVMLGDYNSFIVSVTPSTIVSDDSNAGLLFAFDADGRSNQEINKNSWVSGDYLFTFSGIDFISSGWENSSLALRTGATAQLNYLPFATDPTNTGWTFEIELKTDTVTDTDLPIVQCIDNGRGFSIYPNKAELLTGRTNELTTEAGTIQSKEGISMYLSTSDFVRIAFVIRTKQDNCLMELYANGVRIAGATYDANSSLAQQLPKNIMFGSAEASTYIRSVKAFNRILSDDELVNSYIVSRYSVSEMMEIYERNNILNSNGYYDAPRTSKRGRLTIKRPGGLIEVFQSTNKKEDFLCTSVEYESPFGKAYDFTCTNCYVRIQGTSSTKYPWKNIRIYLAKGNKPQLTIGGKLVTGQTGDTKADLKKNKYSMKEGAVAVSVFTLKCDYSDSSMTHNTGLAKMFHYLNEKLEIKMPAIVSGARASIDGYPCDLYSGEADGSNVEYYGQYNFNNDKSKADAVFGMGSIDAAAGACSLEFLNNTQPLCLFKTASAEDSSFDSFDDALEFNIPEDTLWDSGAEIVATEGQRTAIKRLWNFIGNCARECGASIDSAEDFYTDISKFRNINFYQQAKDYFDIDNMLMWYLLTDYLTLVDQRAKNMFLRTWDGRKWWFTYYDGDTALGNRNDAFLAYNYDVERNSFDIQANKYAFEGHSSWLWCLVLANFSAELNTMAQRLRKEMTNNVIFDFLNTQQMNAWSERAYNKSGEKKYIIPATKGTFFKDSTGSVTKQISNYLYALHGNRFHHRINFIRKRFALLDAKYQTETFRADNIDGYISREAGDAPSVIKITSQEIYRFGYGTNNKPLLAVTDTVGKQEVAQFQITGAFTVNDPIRIYGAQAIRVLDLTGINGANKSVFPLQNGLILTKCTSLREIRAGQRVPSSTGSCVIYINGLTSINHIDISNINGISINKLGSIDLSELKLLKYFDGRGTGRTVVTFADGCQITEAYMPETLTNLTLRNLPNLTLNNLHITNWSLITSLNFANCPNIDWKILLSRCINLRYVRIEDVVLEGDGSELDEWNDLQGLTTTGEITQNPAFIGTYKFTKFRDDIDELRIKFNQLSLVQTPWTCIEYSQKTSSTKSLSNLDNKTGFKFGNEYVVSGHIKKIQSLRDRVLTCYDSTTETLYWTKLHRDNANNYADGTPAVVDGSLGFVMMHEPKFWFKGASDWMGSGNKFAWLTTEKQENHTNCLKILTSDTNSQYLKVLSGKAINVAGTDYNSMLVNNSSFTTYEVTIPQNAGYKSISARTFCKIGINSHVNNHCVFTDDRGNIISSVIIPEPLSGFNGYLRIFVKIPEGAAKFYTAACTSAIIDDYIVLTPETDLFYSETDWVERKECFVDVTFSILHENGQWGSFYKDNFNVAQATIGSWSGVISTAKSIGKDWSTIDYDTWKSILLHNAFYCGDWASLRTYFGDVRSTLYRGASFIEPMDNFHQINSQTTAKYIDYKTNQEVNITRTYHTLGYEDWITNGHFFGTALNNNIVQSYGYNLWDSFTNWIIDGRPTTFFQQVIWQSHLGGGGSIKYMLWENNLDLIGVATTGSTSLTQYFSNSKVSFQGANEKNVTLSFTVNRPVWTDYGPYSFAGPTQNVCMRRVYKGKHKELSKSEYIEKAREILSRNL